MSSYLKIGSHRAYDKVVDYLGYKPPEFYNMMVSHHLFEIPAEVVEEVCLIKSVSKACMKEIKDSNGYTFHWARTWGK